MQSEHWDLDIPEHLLVWTHLELSHSKTPKTVGFSDGYMARNLPSLAPPISNSRSPISSPRATSGASTLPSSGNIAI